MADGLCDWQGCADDHVRPAILRVHREDGDPGHIQDIARRYELCSLHTLMLMEWVNTLHVPLEDIPFDAGAGE